MLDPPAGLRGADEALGGDLGGQARDPALHRFALALGTLGDQPDQRAVPSSEGFGRGRRADPQGHEVRLIAAFEPLRQVTVQPWLRPAAGTCSRQETGRVR